MKSHASGRRAGQTKRNAVRAARIAASLAFVVVMLWGMGNPLEPWKETDAEGKAILIGFLIFIVCCIWYYRKGDQKTENPFHCRKCGYNLTGNRSGTCPECGEPILSGSR